MALGNAINTVQLSMVDEVQIVEFRLNSIYPNPFNPNTTIPFALPEEGHVKISVYNLQGHEIAELVNQVFNAGDHIINWDGSELSSGVYLINMQSGGFNTTQKVVLMK